MRIDNPHFLKINHIFCLIFFFFFFSKGFSQTIDLSKPVGTTAGQAGATATGGVSYTIPLKILKGTNGMEPKINLVYNSQGAEGIAGFGWSLSAYSIISRQGNRQYYNGNNSPVNYNNSNDAFLLDGQHLFPVTGNNGDNGTVYGTENESFSKIESFGGSATSGPDRFKVTTRDGMILEYGSTTDSKFLTDNGQSVLFWFLKKVIDKSGNYQEYKYFINQTDRDFALIEIDYTGNSNTGQVPYNKIEFSYSVIPNALNRKVFEGGASITSPFLLDKVNIKNADGIIVKKYQCGYTTVKNQSFLSSFTETGSDGTILNPLTFKYGSNPNASDVNVSPSYPGFNGNNTFTGELTGDGKQDVIAARYQMDNNNIPHYTAYDVIDDFSVYAGQPGLSVPYTYPIPQNTGTVIDIQGMHLIPAQPYVAPNRDYRDFITNDYDGDGKSDVLMTSNVILSNKRIFSGIKINYSRNYNGWAPTYQTVDYPQMPHDYYSTDDWKYIWDPGTYFVQGDFDGDGAQDYILILSASSTTVNSYRGFFSSPAKGIVNKVIKLFGVSGNLGEAYSIASSTNIIPLDFDGDGKQELLVIKPNSSYILSISPISTDIHYSYQASVLYTFSDILDGYKVFTGDFNGDGKTDLLVRTSANSSTAPWNILYSTGTAYKSYPFIFQNRPYLNGDNGGSAHHLLVADFNNDGKTDIWHSLDLSASSSKHTMYISNGVPLDNSNSTSAFSIYDYTANSSINRDQTVQSVYGDFNFDGKPDIFSIKGTNATIVYPKPNKEENLMVQSTNGLGAVTNFNYQKGYNRSPVYEYDNPSVPLGQGANGNPYTVLKTPMYVLNTLTEPNGSGAYKYTYMQYEDAMYQPLRGFLGFKKVTSTDGFTGISSITYSEMENIFLTSVILKSTTERLGSLLTETNITNNLVRINPANSLDKRFASQVTKNTNFNYITGSGSQTTNIYDEYGNIIGVTSIIGPFSGTTITALESARSSSSFISSFTPVPSLPESTTVTKTRTGQPAVKTTTYSYNSKGLLASVTDFSGTAIANTLSNTYDNFGNVLTQTSSISNTPVLTNTYDTKGRYLLTKSTTGSGITKTESYTYNSLNDNITTAISSDGLTTSFNYDGFGNVIKTTLPDGNIIMNSLAWESTTGRYSKTSYRYSDNGMWNKTYFDLIGREVRKESKGFNNQLIFSTTSYNSQGLLYKQTQPQYSSEPTVEVTNTYDPLQRLSSVSNGATTSTYSYALATGGLFTTTTTNGAGQSSSKTVDASGKVVKTTDKGGQLNFIYDSWGNQKEVQFGGMSLIVNTYDNYGRQISLTDKNAGTITYEYNALNKLTKQTDAKNNIQTFFYDAFGRVDHKTSTTTGTTTYTYYNSAGKVNDNITSITGFAGDVKTFQYDNFQRPLSESTTFDGGTVTKTFEYNSKGDLTKTTYSTGLAINDTYDNNGILTQTSMTFGGVTQNLFTATAINSRGVYTGYNYGNGKSSTLTYDLVKGIPTRYYTAGIQDLNLNFDANTGNLLSRNEAIKGVTETFTYDNLNRLTGSSVNNVAQFTMTYDLATNTSAGNSSLGNIQTKSDIGNYRYDAQKINALRFVTTNSGTPTNPPNIISVNTQSITYTPFLKAATINENGYQVAYTYGQDEQRIKSILTQNGITLETKYYGANYERQIKPGGIDRHLHYISSGNGLCAIVVIQAGVATPYFVYSDHLGSLLTLTNSTGTVVAEQNFDAWGRYRNPANWTYSSIPARPDWLYRGFTGHEHLAQFALINMNGRMYDPTTCRMLSPDNYVPLPWNTQGYNRYGYANNNPLIYTDPDGNFFFLMPLIHFLSPMIVGAAIGATTSAVIYSLTSGSSFTWNGFAKSASIGAVGGAIGGGLGLLTKGLGAFSQSMTYGIMQNMATQAAVNLAFGYDITTGSLIGAGIGGMIDGAIPKFKGIAFKSYNFGARVANAFAELAINAARGVLVGGLSSTISGGSFSEGARSGAVGGLVRTAVNIAVLGPTIRPTGDIMLALNKEEKNLGISLTGAYGPTYRSGGLWTRGLTVNGFSMINDNGDGVDNASTWVHESYHFYQLIKQSWAAQFMHGIYEQWWLNQLKGIDVYDYKTYGTQYNESAAQYYQKVTYPSLP